MVHTNNLKIVTTPPVSPKISTPVLTNTDGSDITSSPRKQSRKRRDGTSLRKAPQAPKRFKSSYILFFMEKQEKIKSQLPKGSSVGDVSKRSSELWKKLSAEERAHWDARAEKDKQRFMTEKAAYTGPWQIPWKRAKKDPSAPKRPMSAFLYFSQDRRGQLKVENPTMRNTEISSILGKLWRDATDDDRRPYVDRELCDRNKYKTVLATWKLEDAVRKEEVVKRKAEMVEQQQQQQQQDLQETYHQQQYPAMPDPYYRSYYHQQQSSHSVTHPESYPPYMPTNYHIATQKDQIHDTHRYPPHLYVPSSYSNSNIQHQEDSQSTRFMSSNYDEPNVYNEEHNGQDTTKFESYQRHSSQPIRSTQQQQVLHMPSHSNGTDWNPSNFQFDCDPFQSNSHNFPG